MIQCRDQADLVVIIRLKVPHDDHYNITPPRKTMILFNSRSEFGVCIGQDNIDIHTKTLQLDIDVS